MHTIQPKRVNHPHRNEGHSHRYGQGDRYITQGGFPRIGGPALFQSVPNQLVNSIGQEQEQVSFLREEKKDMFFFISI